MTEHQPATNVVACLVIPHRDAHIVSSKDLEQTFRRYRRKWVEPFVPVAAIEIELESFRSISGIAISQTRPITVTLAEAARVFGRLGIPSSVRSAFVFHLTKAPAPGLIIDWAKAVRANN
jgi:hypothetical protein